MSPLFVFYFPQLNFDAWSIQVVEGGGIQHLQIKLKFWHYTTNKFDL